MEDRLNFRQRWRGTYSYFTDQVVDTKMCWPAQDIVQGMGMCLAQHCTDTVVVFYSYGLQEGVKIRRKYHVAPSKS